MSDGTQRAVARVRACALWGLDAGLVTVEVDVANGLPAFTIVGLPDAAVQEARERVRAAIRNSGYEFPLRRVTVNLAPAERRKEGSGFDLPIALGILRASGQLGEDVRELCMGELALDGSARPVRGMLARARAASLIDGDITVIVSTESAGEAAVLGLRVIAVDSLHAAVAHLRGTARLAPIGPPLPATHGAVGADLADIAGQEAPKRALEVAAAGGHNVLLVGPPGTGKTLLAKALPSILPPLAPEESVAVSAIHSVAGLLDLRHPLLVARPFRSPHHTASRLALVGGGSPPRPGEVSLAHGGALFLDELPEFSPYVLDTLREPLQEGWVTISRAGATATYPARFLLIAACNPCPCGFAGDPDVACSCLPEQVERYRGRVSGPLMDRIDLRVAVARIPFDRLRATERSEPSCVVRERVTAARERATVRGHGTNAEMSASELRRHCALDERAERLLGNAVRQRHLSPRAYHRTLRVARTLADLGGRDRLAIEDVAYALLLRAP